MLYFFLFCIFTDKKQQSRVFETGSVGLADTTPIFNALSSVVNYNRSNLGNFFTNHFE